MTKKARTPGALPPEAAPAWRAYRDMLASKDAHYGFLEALARKYEGGGSRSLSETARLETLLAAHDRCVRKFADEIKALSAVNGAARDALLILIAESGGTDEGTTH